MRRHRAHRRDLNDIDAADADPSQSGLTGGDPCAPDSLSGMEPRLPLAALLATLLAACSTTPGATNPADASTDQQSGIARGQARTELEAGNLRFLQGGMQSHAWHDEQVVRTGRDGQTPSVGVLGCADSRVPVELVFDQGVGDLFVVRMAGNFDTPGATATFEYGVAALGVHTLLVLGHTKCGAVGAAVAGKPLPGGMSMFAENIRPAIEHVMANATGKTPEQLQAAAEEANVRAQMKQLEAGSAILREAKGSKGLQILGAIYDVDTGRVRFLD